MIREERPGALAPLQGRRPSTALEPLRAVATLALTRPRHRRKLLRDRRAGPSLSPQPRALRHGASVACSVHPRHRARFPAPGSPPARPPLRPRPLPVPPRPPLRPRSPAPGAPPAFAGAVPLPTPARGGVTLRGAAGDAARPARRRRAGAMTGSVDRPPGPGMSRAEPGGCGRATAARRMRLPSL